jgi:hypothetical protein
VTRCLHGIEIDINTNHDREIKMSDDTTSRRRPRFRLGRRDRDAPAGPEQCDRSSRQTDSTATGAEDRDRGAHHPLPAVNNGPGTAFYRERRETALRLFLLQVARHQLGVLDEDGYDQFGAYQDATARGLLETSNLTWRVTDGGVAQLERWGVDCSALLERAHAEQPAAPQVPAGV